MIVKKVTYFKFTVAVPFKDQPGSVLKWSVFLFCCLRCLSSAPFVFGKDISFSRYLQMTVCYFLPKSAGISPHLAVSHLMIGLRKFECSIIAQTDNLSSVPLWSYPDERGDYGPLIVMDGSYCWLSYYYSLKYNRA